MRLAITGASGRLGRLTADALRRRAPACTLRLITRYPEQIAPSGVDRTEVVRGDFNDVDSLATAFADVGTLLLISADGPPAMRLTQHLQAIAVAAQSGVSRIIYTSGSGARADSLSALARAHAATEAALRASGTAYTILRNAQYAEVLKGYIASSMGADCLIMPSASARVTYVPRANAAEAAAGAMLAEGKEKATYEITGSHALTAQDIAELIGSVRAKTPRVVDADHWEYLQAAAVPFGTPRFVIRAMEENWALALEGEFDTVSGDADHLARPKLVTLPDYVVSATQAGVL